jgi:hypothetical protein
MRRLQPELSPSIFVAEWPATEAAWTPRTAEGTLAQVKPACNQLITLGITEIYRTHQDLAETSRAIRKRLGK